MNRRCLGCMETFGEEYSVCPHCGYVVGTRAEEAIHLEPGTLLYDRYIIGKVLGFGGFGVTYVAWDGKLEQKVAIKEYMPGEFSTRMPGRSQLTIFNGDKNQQFHDGLTKFVDEAKRLARFQNEAGIVKIFDSFEENETAYIVMEYLDGENLSEMLKRRETIPEDEAVDMIRPILSSLQAVHAEGLLHRDIAPDNIFITKSGEVKLIDFGASRYATTSHSRSLTVIIKPGYSPEEQYRSRGDQGAYTDVYSVAATLYKMMTGKTPPDAMERRAKYEGENKDILVPPHKLVKKISLGRENAILNAMNVRIEDRTPDVATFAAELDADPPAKRIYGKIKKIDLYRMPLWLKVSVPLVLCLVIVFSALLLTGVIDLSLFSDEIVIPENVVVVPDVEGQFSADALKIIEEGKLLAQTAGVVESEYIPAGKIILQDPVGGSYMNINGTVMLTVSSGKGVQEAVDGVSTVPFIVWDTKDDGIAKLLKAGLGQPKVEEAYDENVTEGMIVSQSVEAGSQVDEGTVITIVVSKGPAPFDMVSVVGMSLVEAEELLVSKGLVVERQFREDSSVAVNTVLEQSIAEGTTVKRGDRVAITVASEVKTVAVANVVGSDSKTAQATLKEQGFKVTVLENYDANVAKDTVISQTPAAGTEAVKDSTVTIYVSKGKQPITVTLDPTGGKLSKESITVYLNDSYGELPEPTKQGYTFAGWYSKESDGVEVTPETEVTTPSAHTLYARWISNEYTVTLNSDGGSVSLSTVTVKQNQPYGSLPEPQRDGYGFLGWYTKQFGGDEVTADTVFDSGKDITLYAKWSASAYTVTFDANGGSVSTTSKTVEYKSEFGVLPDATMDGYTFVGWYTSASGGSEVTSGDVLDTASSITLYAQWSANSYTVTLYGNGGNPDVQTVSVEYMSAYGALSAPSKDGYTFDGWYTSATGGDLVTADTTYTAIGDSALYAHWTTNKYTVSFDGKGGSSANSITVEYMTPYGSLPTPTRNGYEFAGWQTSDGASVDSSSVMTTAGDSTLYAQWEAKAYTVSLDVNSPNGELSTTSVSVTYGETYVGQLPSATRHGYMFVGWFTAASGGERVIASTIYNHDKDITLYAQWNPERYKVWFDANGGSCAETSTTCIQDEKYGALPDAERYSYKFAGWYTEKTGGTLVTEDSIFTNGDVQYLYAHWTLAEYTLTFDANGGSCDTSSKAVIYGHPYGALPEPTKNGYKFAGWYTAKDGGTEVDYDTKLTTEGNVTVYAHWTANKYVLTFNANGGSVSTSNKSVTYGQAYGDLPTPTRDYYTFKGWYTAASGGTKVESSTELTTAGNVTVYAQWTQNATSDWVDVDDMPAGAGIVNSRWTYTLREYTTNSASSLSGWTKYDTKTSWSDWSNWSTTDPTDGVKNVESRSVYDHTEYHYYRWIKRSGSNAGTYSWKYDSTFTKEEIWTTYELPVSDWYANNNGYDMYVCYEGTDGKSTNLWIRADAPSNSNGRYVDRAYTRDIYRTEWRYQTLVYTYYYYRDVQKGPVYTDPTGLENVISVQKQVQYIPK